MSSEDITFCGYENCPDKTCERRMCHIRDYRILHSFAYFDDCSVHKQLRGDGVLATCEALSTMRRIKNETDN